MQLADTQLLFLMIGHDHVSGVLCLLYIKHVQEVFCIPPMLSALSVWYSLL